MSFYSYYFYKDFFYIEIVTGFLVEQNILWSNVSICSRIIHINENKEMFHQLDLKSHQSLKPSVQTFYLEKHVS